MDTTNRNSIIAGNNPLAITIAVVCGTIWLVLFAYVMWDDSPEQKNHKPGAVVVHSPSPTATNGLVVCPTMKFVHTGISYSGAVSTGSPSAAASSYSFSMHSTSMRMHETSRASVHTIGSGGGSGSGGSMATTSRSAGKNNGAHAIAMAYSGAIYVPRTSNAVTEVGASSANEVASTTTSPQAATPGMHRVGGNPHGPFPEPVGDVTWALMALLAAAYALYHAFLRKTPPTRQRSK